MRKPMMNHTARLKVLVVPPFPPPVWDALAGAGSHEELELVMSPADRFHRDVPPPDDSTCDVVLLYVPELDAQQQARLSRIRTEMLTHPVVVLTDGEGGDGERIAEEAGAQGYLPRSRFTLERLAQTAQQAIDQYECEAALHQHRHALQVSAINLRNIIDHSTDGIVVVDREGVIQFANPAAEALFGQRATDLRGLPFPLPLVPGETTEATLLTANGSTRTVELRVSPLAWEGEAAHLVTLRDITVQKQADRVLNEKRDFSVAVLDTVAALVLVLDREGRIVRLNQAWVTLSGYGAEEALGAYFWDLFVPPDEMERVRTEFERLRNGQLPSELTNYIVTRSGERKLIAWSNTVLRDAAGNVEYIMATGVDVTERAAIERTLQQSEARFRAVFAQSAIGMLLAGADGRLVESNAAIQKLLGYTAEELRQRSFADITHPDDLPLNRRLFHEVSTGKRDQYQLEKRYIRRDGEPVWVRVTAYAVKDPGTDNPLVLAMAEDITQRKQAEQAEAEQRALSQALREAAETITMTLELDEVLDRLLASVARVIPHDSANIMLVEDGVVQVVRWLGHYDEPALQTWLRTLRMPIAAVPNLQRVWESGEPHIIPDTAHEPGWRHQPETAWIRAHITVPIRRHGKVFGFLNLDSATPDAFTREQARLLQTFADHAGIAIWNAQLYDAVRQHAAELEERVAQRTLELAQKRAQLETILDAMGEGVVYLDEHGDVLYTNRAFSELLGYASGGAAQAPAEIYRAAFAAFDGTGWRDEVAAALARGEEWCGEGVLRRADGSTFDAALTIDAVHGPDGHPIGQVELIRDISQEKALREQKDRFIANASHELRTPITNLKMRLYLLRKDPTSLLEHLRVLEYVMRRMEALVDDLLDLSRFERGTIQLEREDIVLQDLIEHVVLVQRPHAEAKNIQLSAQLPASPLISRADANRLVQVLTNLLTNAINYTREQGKIEVSLASEIEHGRPYAVIRVSDTGAGIPPDQLNQIFEPFFRATHAGSKGTGLGLTISKEIIEQHGGTITVDSHFGEGSTFTIRLALSDRPAPQSAFTG